MTLRQAHWERYQAQQRQALELHKGFGRLDMNIPKPWTSIAMDYFRKSQVMQTFQSQYLNEPVQPCADRIRGMKANTIMVDEPPERRREPWKPLNKLGVIADATALAGMGAISKQALGRTLGIDWSAEVKAMQAEKKAKDERKRKRVAQRRAAMNRVNKLIDIRTARGASSWFQRGDLVQFLGETEKEAAATIRLAKAAGHITSKGRWWHRWVVQGGTPKQTPRKVYGWSNNNVQTIT